MTKHIVFLKVENMQNYFSYIFLLFRGTTLHVERVFQNILPLLFLSTYTHILLGLFRRLQLYLLSLL